MFDWAVGPYNEFFNGPGVDGLYEGYTYRFFPATQNYVGVKDGNIYVLGPLSGGNILFVASVAEFRCQVFPSRCSGTPSACAPVTAWTVNGNVCAPTTVGGQVPHNSEEQYFDTSAPTIGSARYRCTDGTLSLVGAASCTVAAPRACNTENITWSVGGNTCTANPGSPTQIPSGASQFFTDSIGTTGLVSYSCSDGTLNILPGATCEAPAPVSSACKVPDTLGWQVGFDACSADFGMGSTIGDGQTFTFEDETGDVRGRNTMICQNGTLLSSGDTRCSPLPRMADSFGSDGGSADGTAGCDGTAGDGAPIVGGRVRVVDRNGLVATATTDNIGYWRTNVTGFEAPLVVTVTRPDGVVRHSLTTQQPKPNQYIFVAVTGLTDWVASKVVEARTGTPNASALTPAMIASDPGAVTNAVQALRNNQFVAPQLAPAGFSDPSTFDPLNMPFRANGTGYDRILDNIVATVSPSGETVIASADCLLPTSWSVGGLTCERDSTDPSTMSPTSGTVVLHDTVGSTVGTAAYTCSQAKVSGPVLPSCRATGQSGSR